MGGRAVALGLGTRTVLWGSRWVAFRMVWPWLGARLAWFQARSVPERLRPTRRRARAAPPQLHRPECPRAPRWSCRPGRWRIPRRHLQPRWSCRPWRWLIPRRRLQPGWSCRAGRRRVPRRRLQPRWLRWSRRLRVPGWRLGASRWIGRSRQLRPLEWPRARGRPASLNGAPWTGAIPAYPGREPDLPSGVRRRGLRAPRTLPLNAAARRYRRIDELGDDVSEALGVFGVREVARSCEDLEAAARSDSRPSNHEAPPRPSEE